MACISRSTDSGEGGAARAGPARRPKAISRPMASVFMAVSFSDRSLYGGGTTGARAVEEGLLEHRIGGEIGVSEVHPALRRGERGERGAAANTRDRHAHRVAIAHQVDPCQLGRQVRMD